MMNRAQQDLIVRTMDELDRLDESRADLNEKRKEIIQSMKDAIPGINIKAFKMALVRRRMDVEEGKSWDLTFQDALNAMGMQLSIFETEENVSMEKAVQQQINKARRQE